MYANILPGLGYFAPLVAAKFATGVNNWSHWRSIYTAYCGFEAGSAIADNRYPRLVESYPKLAEIAQKSQKWIWIPSLIATAGCALEFVSLLDKKFLVFPHEWFKGSQMLYSPTTFAAGFATYLGIFAGVAAAVVAVKTINNYFWKVNEAKKLVANESMQAKMAYDHPSKELAQEAMLVTRVVLGSACLYLGFSYLTLACVALESASLISIAKRQWVKYSLSYPNYKPNTTIVLHFFMRAYQMNQKVKDNCGICIDDINSAEKDVGNKGVLACKKHIFHLNCISTWISQRAPEILNGLQNLRSIKFDNKSEYAIDLRSSKIPNCPTCRELPMYQIEGHVIEGKNTCALNINLLTN